jgi:hypothetical protein
MTFASREKGPQSRLWGSWRLTRRAAPKGSFEKAGAVIYLPCVGLLQTRVNSAKVNDSSKANASNLRGRRKLSVIQETRSICGTIGTP